MKTTVYENEINAKGYLRFKCSVIYSTILFALLLLISTLMIGFDSMGHVVGPFITVFWIVTLTIVLFLLFSSETLNNNEMIILAGAWAFRCLYVFIHCLFEFSSDAEYFVSLAKDYYIGENMTSYDEYGYLLNVEFHFFGPNEVVLAVFNEFLAMLAVFVFIKILNYLEIGSHGRSIPTIIVAYSFPSVIFCGQGLREAVYVATLLFSFLCFVKWVNTRAKLYAVMTLLLTLPSIWLHSGHVAFAAAYFIIFLFGRSRRLLDGYIYKMCLVLFGLIMLYYVLNSSSIGYLMRVTNLLDDGSEIDWVQSGSEYLGWMQTRGSVLRILMFTPIRMFYFLFSPVIWNARGLSDLAVILFDSSFFIYGFFSAFMILKSSMGKRKKTNRLERLRYTTVAGSVFIALAMAAVYGWGTMSAGTAIRHRSCVLPLMCIAIAVRIQARKEKKKVYDEKNIVYP